VGAMGISLVSGLGRKRNRKGRGGASKRGARGEKRVILSLRGWIRGEEKNWATSSGGTSRLGREAPRVGVGRRQKFLTPKLKGNNGKEKDKRKDS